MKPLEWTAPHGIVARGALSFLYFSRVVDDTDFEYRYIGRTEDGAKRLRAYPTTSEGFSRGCRAVSHQGQDAYRAVSHQGRRYTAPFTWPPPGQSSRAGTMSSTRWKKRLPR